jgi:uncharacterized protein YciI
MFVVELVYKADLSAIDAAMKDHMRFLERGYEAGIFVVSGRKIPREGGILIATGVERAELAELMAQDPFVARGLADVRIIEFRASQRAADVNALLAKEPSAPSRRARRV